MGTFIISCWLKGYNFIEMNQCVTLLKVLSHICFFENFAVLQNKHFSKLVWVTLLWVPIFNKLWGHSYQRLESELTTDVQFDARIFVIVLAIHIFLTKVLTTIWSKVSNFEWNLFSHITVPLRNFLVNPITFHSKPLSVINVNGRRGKCIKWIEG